MNMKRGHFYIKTMGCQMNVYESDYVYQILKDSGYEYTDDPGRADLIVINTCTVRKKAEQKAYSHIGRMLSLKRIKPHMRIAVLGCMAQQQGQKLLERFPDIDLVMGPREIEKFKLFLTDIIRGAKIVATDLRGGPVGIIDCAPRVPSFKSRVTGFVSIMQGCNNFCSYCIVPYVRGREVSRSLQDIVAEVKMLVNWGIKDITLLGQNVNSYRYKDYDFARLLQKVHEVEGLLRLRFTTSHPKDVSQRLIQCFRDLPKLCSHIHLPFQAGSDRILRLMNRGYTKEHYMELIQKLKDARPGIAITSDVMVGFPRETEEDFIDTLDLIRRVEFDNLFSFKYSDREGTPAHKMQGKIPEEEKQRRLELLQSIQKEITLKKNREMEGRIVDVLVEGKSKRGNTLTGRTDTNKIVNFIGNFDLIGKMVKIKVLNGYQNSLFGELF